MLLFEQQYVPESILIFVVTTPISVNYAGAPIDVRHVVNLEVIFESTDICSASMIGVDELTLVEYMIG